MTSTTAKSDAYKIALDDLTRLKAETENDRVIREAHNRQCSAYLLISRRAEKQVRR